MARRSFLANVVQATLAWPFLMATAIASYAGFPLPSTRTGAEKPPRFLVREHASDFSPIPHPEGGPSRILLMRHADKPDDPEDEGLSPAGIARAGQLVDYIPKTFGKPDFVIATAHSKHSNRPVDTVTPLASALGMHLEDSIENDEFEDLAAEVFSNPIYRGKTVLICWHHGKIPAIAALLGASPGSYPDPWPDDTYNLILDFRYDPNTGAPPAVAQVVEPF